MSVKYSTDKKILDSMNKYLPYDGCKKGKTPFVFFNNRKKGDQCRAFLSTGLMDLTCMVERVMLAYDDETHELLIIPSLTEGNIKCSITGRNNLVCSVPCYGFFKAIGLVNLPEGRYSANVDKDGKVHVYLDCKLERRVRKGEV